MNAKDIMRKKVITVGPGMTLRELARLFIDKHISGAPVVDDKGKLVGVVSQTDLVRQERESLASDVPDYHLDSREGMRANGFHIEVPDYTRVKDVMTPSAIAYCETTPVKDLARAMLRKHIHRVLITREGALCGIVTTMDLLRALVEK